MTSDLEAARPATAHEGDLRPGSRHTLADLAVGRSAVIVAIDAAAAAGPASGHDDADGDALAQRLAVSGLWPGVAVQCIARAPFGDPLLFRLHGYRLALRRSEARRVLVAECAS